MLYKQLLSESPQNYPYLKGNDLDAFFQKHIEDRSQDKIDAIDSESLHNRSQFIKNVIIQFKTSAKQNSFNAYVKKLI